MLKLIAPKNYRTGLYSGNKNREFLLQVSKRQTPILITSYYGLVNNGGIKSAYETTLCGLATNAGIAALFEVN